MVIETRKNNRRTIFIIFILVLSRALSSFNLALETDKVCKQTTLGMF